MFLWKFKEKQSLLKAYKTKSCQGLLGELLRKNENLSFENEFNSLFFSQKRQRNSDLALAFEFFTCNK